MAGAGTAAGAGLRGGCRHERSGGVLPAEAAAARSRMAASVTMRAFNIGLPGAVADGQPLNERLPASVGFRPRQKSLAQLRRQPRGDELVALRRVMGIPREIVAL